MHRESEQKRSPWSDGELGDLKISEIFSSIQGEGASAGTRCLFLRLALCNLRCTWCDTKYTWDFANYRYADEVRTLSCASVRELIVQCPERRVVITGGEPMLQKEALSRMLWGVPRQIAVEVETNGTLLPTQELLERVDQWNVSPKLAHSGEPEARRLRLEVLARLRETRRAFLKIVLQEDSDLAEAESLVCASDWPRERVLLMPEAQTRADYQKRATSVQALCQAHAFGFSPRLQVVRWDGARGR